METDFVLGDAEVAIEVKGARRVDKKDLHGLTAFIEALSPKRALVVCNGAEDRLLGKIKVMYWRHFLEELWQGKVMR